ncbi:type IX secretion system membrane protein, PorP/SprF family [Mariniphaga anaerophila]|uniref:Type IX secretion system membrane protein, PorP/SprF family n=1 Tax=Mariniphaga anaerophila TaxID=1484053 RepID=A0A1M4ZVG0_9BACT|nr:type IX secretion system membrane protein PorP/SprF [Mariniphaga anaerophila]SHF21971.1 type IX secretion system membrane protein, PorP/SprF family [Mariniphaga anaerophila]
MRFGLYFLLLVFLSGTIWAQDPGFSQFYANPLYLNPAFAGTTELPRLGLNYRNQWPQKGATFITYSVSYDKGIKNSNAGLGFQAMRDQELNNVINSQSASVLYSHHLKLGFESFMTLGLQGGFTLKQFNIHNLVFPSGIDQLSGEISEYVAAGYSDGNKLYPDFAVGAMGQHGEFFWGAAAHHLTRPNESIIRGDQKGEIPIKATVHAGARLRRLHHGLLSRVFTLSPNILYQQQGNFKQLNLGIYMIEKSFLFGGWYRNNIDIRPDAIIALAGFAKEKFQIGYSFDLTLSKMSNYSYGSHEISLVLYLGQKQEIPPRDKLLIPMI